MVSCGDFQKPKKSGQEEKQLPHTRKEITLSFAPVVKKVAPAVVNIYAIHHPKVDLSNSPFMADPFFRHFFEKFHQGQGMGREQTSLGSGMLVSKEGLVLTNYHVVKNADVIQVALADKREFSAKLIITDTRTDLAILKIQGNGEFPFLTVSPQEDLEVGDLVLAIGNPFGVGQTVTSGIVSALARSEEGINDFRTFIQTDAAINPGNSGGPLVTTDGRLVGINTAIFSKTGGSMGIGFAIPTALAIPVIESSKNGGRIIRPWSGLDVSPVTFETAQALGLSHPHGALVKDVYPQGPGDKAGIKVGDFISAIDDRKIEDDAFLNYQIAVSSLGEKRELTLIRKGDVKKVSILLTEPSGEQNPTILTVQGPNPLQGMKLQALSPVLALSLGLSPMKQGVIIADTNSASHLGLQQGDILESINKVKVKSIDDALKLLQMQKPFWSLVFMRGNKAMTLQVTG